MLCLENDDAFPSGDFHSKTASAILTQSYSLWWFCCNFLMSDRKDICHG